MPSRYIRKTTPKAWPVFDRGLGPAWPEPLVPDAPRLLAMAAECE